MNVADLFAKLGIKMDQASFSRARGELGKLAGHATAQTTKITSQFSGMFKGLLAASGIGLGVGGAIGAIKEQLNFDKQLTALGVSSSGAMGSMQEVTDAILSVSDATGVSKEQLLASGQAFVALTGDGEAAKKSMETFAKVAIATGADMGDIAATGAAMGQALQIKPEEFEKAFSILVKGGKMGAVELKDLASVMSSILPMSTQFAEGMGTEGLSKTAAALQLIRRGNASAKQSLTQYEALLSSLTGKATKFGEVGVRVFDIDPKTGKKNLRDIQKIIAEISGSALAKDPEALTKILGSKEAYAAYIQLTKVSGEWENLTKATMDAKDVSEDYVKVQQSTSARVSKAWNSVKNNITRATAAVIEFGVEAVDGVSDLVRGIEQGNISWSDFKGAGMAALGAIGEVASFIGGKIAKVFDGVSSSIADSTYDFIGGFGTAENKRKLREEGLEKGLIGKELDSFVSRGVSNQVIGNSKAAKELTGFRQSQNVTAALGRAEWEGRNNPLLNRTVARLQSKDASGQTLSQQITNTVNVSIPPELMNPGRSADLARFVAKSVSEEIDMIMRDTAANQSVAATE